PCLSFFFSSRRLHTRCYRDWSSDVCSSDLQLRGRRARWASACPVVGRRAQRSSVSTSSSVSVIGFFGRSRRLGVRLVYTENAFEIGRAACRERVEGARLARAITDGNGLDTH